MAFNSRSVPRNATDKTSPARFPIPSATLRLKETREGAPRTLGRQKVPRDLRLRKCPQFVGPVNSQPRPVQHRGPRTEPRPCMVLELKPMGKPSTKNKNYKCWTVPRPCMVLGLKPMGKPSTKNKNYKCWTVPRPCMVLGPKPMGKPNTWIRKGLNFVRWAT